MDTNNHFSLNLQLGNHHWSKTSAVALGFFQPLNAGNAKGADLCPASWAIQGKWSLEQEMWREGSSRNLPWVMFGIASLGGMSQEGFPLPLSTRGAQPGLVTPLSSTGIKFLFYTCRSLCGQRCEGNSAWSWGSGSVLQNCCKAEFCGLRAKVLRI